MADKQIKVLEKLLAQEAKADEQKVQRAVKEMQKAEKAYQRSVKETEKAVKAHQKAGEQKLKAAKALNSAEKKFNDAAANREKAERKTTELSQRENMEEQDLQQRHSQISQAFSEFHSNEHSRIRRRSEMIDNPVAGSGVSADATA